VAFSLEWNVPVVVMTEAAGFVEAVVAAVAEFAVKRVAPSTPPVKTDPATVSAATALRMGVIEVLLRLVVVLSV
jgi:hypothetical protein